VALSKTQIDKLGERLKVADPIEADLRELDEYRRSFFPQHQAVVLAIEQQLQLRPTGRVPKTIPSIIAKLRRESIRLSQIQDISGCRLVVDSVEDQDRIIGELKSLFEDVGIIDISGPNFQSRFPTKCRG
jgi:putative GTP pyrophosphokinase